jgi:glyoxylase-like metal-dependent hydrolase (beta-lactamase superfamily II)
VTTTRPPTPSLPAPVEVADGVWSIALPLLKSPLGSVLVYAVEHDAGVLLVDAGYADEACWNALAAGLAAAGRSVTEVTGIALTHNHPDHVGLADRIRETTGAWVAVHPLDALSPEQRHLGTFFEQVETELVLAGVPRATLEQMLADTRALATHSENLRADRFLEPGLLLEEHGRALRVVATPGHTRGHVCLHDERTGVLFGGDLLLATGEVQLGVVVTPTDDPAGELISSMALVSELDVSLVLPGHGPSFTDVPTHAAAASAALERRIDQTAEQVRALPGRTCWEHAGAYPWDRPWERMSEMGRRFAVMQTMGWLRRLVATSRAALDPGPPERTTAT